LGLVCSVILHVAILAWAIFTIQTQREFRVPEPEPIMVDLVTEGELTRLRQGARTAKQLEAQPKEAPKSEPSPKESAKPKPVAAAPPPAASEPPAPKEEPKRNEIAEKLAAVPPPPASAPPVPAPEEQKKLDDMLKEQERQAEELRKAEEQKRLEEEKQRKEAEAKKKRDEDRRKKLADLKKKREDEQKRKEAEAKKQFDAEKISALLNKIPDKGAPRPSVPLDEQAKSLNKGPVLGAPEGRDQKLSASELAVIGQIIRQCVQSKWNVQAGGESAQDMLVKLRLRFNPDGTLASEPIVMNPQGTTFFLAFSEGAKRAAQACEPYSLPRDKYDVWKDIVLNFSLREMIR
jgi:colicin import membrane protein